MNNSQQDEAFFINIIVNQTHSEFSENGFVGSVTPELIRSKYEEISKKLNFILNDERHTRLMNLIRSKIDIVIDPAVMITSDEAFVDWYSRDKLGKYWDRYSSYLKLKPLSPVVINRLDEDTDKILGRISNPISKEPFNCRGMVVGDVQAGKTQNYSALINKACDVGYQVIIVLTGVTEDLRNQTQIRLDEDFVGQESSVGNQQRIGAANKVGVGHINFGVKPLCLTDKETDFTGINVLPIDSINEPILIVAKKNISVLEQICSWLGSQKKDHREKVQNPFLIIDDEADSASVNTGDKDQQPKAINHAIRRIIDNCAKVTYIGYTATPFANIFISPDDNYDASDIKELFPKDFIVSLMSPPNYCGGEFFFVDDDYSKRALRFIEDAENFFPSNKKIKNQSSGLPESLKTAIKQFFIAAAIKDIRRGNGEIRSNLDSCFDSMLINISTLKIIQNDLKPLIKDEVEKITRSISFNRLNDLNNDFIANEIKKIFEGDFEKNLDSKITWEQLRNSLIHMEEVKVLSINGDSEDSLSWKEKDPKKIIAIGGLTLSRGITLNGLVISYLYRNSTMYDTIMQMGRWFGYRDGYRDIVRLWCTSNVAYAYKNATYATQELKFDIVLMNKQKMTPRSFGMKVASYPGLLPTARKKMQLGVQITHSVSFDDKKRETFLFNMDDHLEIKNKKLVIEITNEIVNKYKKSISLNSLDINSNVIFENVSGDLVVPFLLNYKYHPSIPDLSESYFRDYLAGLKLTDLSKWNVIYFSRKTVSKDAGVSSDLSRILSQDINSQERSLFVNVRGKESDPPCVPLSANRQLATAGIETYSPNRTLPSLFIHSIKVGDPSPAKAEIPEFLIGLKGKEFFGLTILFPASSHDREITSFKCIASPDYVRRYIGDINDVGDE
jgi:hypothetical protein